MKIKLIGCQSTMNEIQTQELNKGMDCEFLDYSFHARPDKLHNKLQEIINKSQDYDLIILSYGRCSNTMIGLISPHVPLMFPATHDCIGLLLGSTVRRKTHLLITSVRGGWITAALPWQNTMNM